MPIKSVTLSQKQNAPVLRKMNQESDNLDVDQREDLVLCDKTVEVIMGPEPVPSLDIEMDAIQDKLQRKMVQELQCIVCAQFPFQAKECLNCNKLFCKYC